MAEENPAMQLLRAIRADIALVRDTQREHGVRLQEIAGGATPSNERVVSLQRTVANMTETDALLHARLDRLSEKIERIEQRLNLLEDGS